MQKSIAQKRTPCVILTYMERSLTYTVDPQHDGTTVLQFLKEQGYTRHIFVLLKQTENGILINGRWAYVIDRLRCGDTLTVRLLEEPKKPFYDPESAKALPSLSIVYDDEDLAVIDKPAQMPVHPSLEHSGDTLAHAAAAHYGARGESFPYRCPSRLDRDTTGLIVLPKHLLCAASLSRQIAERTFSRTYLAVCRGKTPQNGCIDAPIARAAGSVMERCVDFSAGAAAVTHYRRLAYDAKEDLSLISLTLDTGRTHQIRVHMKYIGFPLIGDFLYNPDYSQIARQALHSYALDFTHPVTHEKKHFTVQLPPDMKRLFPSF